MIAAAYASESSIRQAAYERLSALRDSMVVSWTHALGHALSGLGYLELPRVDALFEHAIPAGQQLLQQTMPEGWRATISGAFVHGASNRYGVRFRPYRAKNYRTCEIADLLVVVEVRLMEGSCRSGLLIQAKKPANPQSRRAPWEGRDDRQFRLYNEQSQFEWAARVPTIRPGEKRCLRPASIAYPSSPPQGVNAWHHSYFATSGRIHAGAVFAPLNSPSPLVLVPVQPLAPSRPLAAVLADLSCMVGGWHFLRLSDAYRGAELEWSAVVWDILRASLGRSFRHRPDRSHDALLEDELGSPMHEDSFPALDGVSVVRIILDGRDDPRDRDCLDSDSWRAGLGGQSVE